MLLRKAVSARCGVQGGFSVALKCNPRFNSGSYVRTVGAASLTKQSATLHPDIGKVLYTQEQLEECLQRLGSQIGRDYADKHVVVIGVLKGGFMFCADLVRHIHPVPSIMEVDFFKASSYGSGMETSGRVKLDSGFDISSLSGKHVLVVEDIVDSGLTLTNVVALLESKGHASSVKVCTLLDKRARRKVQFEADYVGFTCPDEFVVGFGIDYSEMYRFLPYIGVPTEAAIARVAAEADSTRAARMRRLVEDNEVFVSDDERGKEGETAQRG
ncbi:hypothetical protein CEUSTIGMA_g6929.t1 [Chlamydomonas eustigma]|uniref:Hypoxanthine phosphoribosyltransferase n=1 Tax=Chlamydomonas eustigma TaxID=1157962 RepID=A0A250X8S9_9CHLO|nr:hypothetical protein CEUSTIGMA_g6929.t1 [Chlamydomonas eustigma]|eukprot:GAX79488.1 hypothetical protein CEUSTIGMA_g6929.t1 [Chlamydomonas eustigma]